MWRTLFLRSSIIVLGPMLIFGGFLRRAQNEKKNPEDCTSLHVSNGTHYPRSLKSFTEPEKHSYKDA